MLYKKSNHGSCKFDRIDTGCGTRETFPIFQSALHAVETWSCDHQMTLNADKCKVMNIDFKKKKNAFEPVMGRNSLLLAPPCS